MPHTKTPRHRNHNRPCTAKGFPRPPKGPAPPDDTRPPGRGPGPEDDGPPGGLVLKVKLAGAVRVGNAYLRILEIGPTYVRIWFCAPSETQIVRAELDPLSGRWPTPRPRETRRPGRRERRHRGR